MDSQLLLVLWSPWRLALGIPLVLNGLALGAFGAGLPLAAERA